MPTILKFDCQRHEATPRYKFGLHKVCFKDRQGNRYEWVPKWDEVRNIYTIAALTEVLNQGQYVQLAKFAHTSSKVLTRVIEVATEMITEGSVDLRKEVDLTFLEEILKERGPR
jgi:hypothetical protein